MFRNYRTQLIMSLMLVLVALLLATVVTAQESDGRGGRFVIADGASNVPLDPFVTSWHSWPHYALYSTLFWRDANQDYVGYLADTWEIGEDGTTLTVNLIDYATFSDGTPVNAEAIRWNLERYIDPAVGASQGQDLVGLLTEVEIVDEYTFTLHLTSSYAPLFYTLYGIEIVSPTAYEALGPDEFGLHPVGAGPFLLKELNPGHDVLFERNPDFRWAPEENYEHPGPVYLDEFQVLFLEEDQTILAALETGEIQFAGIPPQNLGDVEGNSDIVLGLQMAPEIRYVGFNTSKAPWDNLELRQAFAYATNREEFVTLAWNDQCEPLYQPLPPSIWGHNPDLDAASYHYEPETAMAMLDELGYVDVDGDGMREQPDGSDWPVRLSVISSDEGRRQAEVLEAQWRDVGILVEIEMLERQALIDLTTTGTHDLFSLYYGYQDPSILTYFFDPARKGGSNRAWFSTDELSALMTTADTTVDPELRYQAVTAVSQYVMDNSPWIFLCVPLVTYGVRTELQNWQMNPNLDLLYLNAYFEVDE